MSHAVARLRAERLARSNKPFIARGSRAERCADCRVIATHCLCAWKPRVQAESGVCLLMHDTEPLKPTNTGWLIADLIEDTWAFGWQRTSVDERLLALLDDPRWQPYIVFPGEFVAEQRVVSEVVREPGKRPLFILLDATWTEARKMFRKSPYLDRFPVLSLQAEQMSRYRLRRSKRDDHFCTAEVAAMCLDLGGDSQASQALDAYLDVFSLHYLSGKRRLPLDDQDDTHQRLHTFL
ncbi:DTW domain-containing protein [Pseudomonas putida]|uniref:tRNA-uridine aminocarboxypropyltransferase n=1 Tax=Pseudomonas putida TaxID=303 RepID=UPI00066E5DD5|nr:tRNA-uridine aminocarboxypropyltransferase [Pseudomonas putida]MBS5848143.1 DTW domain-containing protein [Pseudomonas putida]MCE0975084.1 DTW domain-containing protein [Pseudomonas putida]MDD2120366.1 DTW domain-containing protein [Pseudomonas putida]UPU93592.1 DTW domain-containing protein [Pseudomonas putida]WQE55381.1 tRNA-uridine aminocarboxypropyltransferase [Pseudomonas putida]